jgi:hypothetical protein
MEPTNELSGFNYKPFTREDLVRNMQERKESGQCSVQDPDFYKPWDMVKVGSEEYELAQRASRELRLERREMLRQLTKKRGKK